VLGHSLTRRLLDRGEPPDGVLAEIRDTEELSRRALADIRATVSGERRMSLAAELVAARAALRAAGIEADLPSAVDDVAGPPEEPLAYVLREGVTNVIRHSGARRCTVRIGPGAGRSAGEHRGGQPSDGSAGPPGHGFDRAARPSGPRADRAGRPSGARADRAGRANGRRARHPHRHTLPGGGFLLRAEAPT
jgi:two-component system sensor histidine kinase DesK